MKSTVASASLLIAFAIFLVSHAEVNSSEDTEDSEEQEVKFCNESTTAEERNKTLGCVLQTDKEDAKRLRKFMENSNKNGSVIADLLCNNTNALNEEILKSEGQNFSTGEEPDLSDIFLECESSDTKDQAI
uniref:14 kDa family member n=1 Tax=Rhipicephalus appendiculatus TaxID=34631 RepID=A0A131YGM9_RHIAP